MIRTLVRLTAALTLLTLTVWTLGALETGHPLAAPAVLLTALLLGLVAIAFGRRTT